MKRTVAWFLSLAVFAGCVMMGASASDDPVKIDTSKMDEALVEKLGDGADTLPISATVSVSDEHYEILHSHQQEVFIDHKSQIREQEKTLKAKIEEAKTKLAMVKSPRRHMMCYIRECNRKLKLFMRNMRKTWSR